MKLNRLLFVFLIPGLSACNGKVISVNTPKFTQHDQQKVTIPDVPKLDQNSNVIVNIEPLTPSVNTPANASEIKIDPNLQKEPEQSNKTTDTVSTGSREASGGSMAGGPSSSFIEEKKELSITDIVLTDTGKSIKEDGDAAIEPDYAGKEINLTITGKFKNVGMSLDNLQFTNEAGLIHQSVVEAEPVIRVLLNDVILFSPVSASETEIKVKIDTIGIPDFYLKGLHKLSIEAPGISASTMIRVGDPAHVDSLSPGIDSVEVIKDDKGNPLNLLVTGFNLMLNPSFSYSQIDGQFGFGHQTNIVDDNNGLVWETIVHIPDVQAFAKNNQHTITYATPFGMAFKRF